MISWGKCTAPGNSLAPGGDGKVGFSVPHMWSLPVSCSQMVPYPQAPSFSLNPSCRSPVPHSPPPLSPPSIMFPFPWLFILHWFFLSQCSLSRCLLPLTLPFSFCFCSLFSHPYRWPMHLSLLCLILLFPFASVFCFPFSLSRRFLPPKPFLLVCLFFSVPLTNPLFSVIARLTVVFFSFFTVFSLVVLSAAVSHPRHMSS